jgi:hypothetical protein
MGRVRLLHFPGQEEAMPQQPSDPRDGRQYEETTAPANPPNSVLQPDVRRTAVWTYLGLLVVFFLIVGAAFLFWTVAGPRVDSDDRTDASAVGTSGARLPREGTAGGFDPAPRSSSTAEEIQSRGGTLNQPGSPQGAAAITSLQALHEQSPQSLAGRRIDLDNVQVERADGGSFSVRQGDERATVVTAGGAPTVQAGQRVDLSGTLEASGNSARIRATRIEVK